MLICSGPGKRRVLPNQLHRLAPFSLRPLLSKPKNKTKFPTPDDPPLPDPDANPTSTPPSTGTKTQSRLSLLFALLLPRSHPANPRQLPPTTKPAPNHQTGSRTKHSPRPQRRQTRRSQCHREALPHQHERQVRRARKGHERQGFGGLEADLVYAVKRKRERQVLFLVKKV